MARNQVSEETSTVGAVEEVPVAQTAVAGATTAAASTDGRSIVLNVNGESIKRTDYIRRRWSEKASRATITKEVNEITKAMNPNAKVIPYQTIFAATKGIPGGPDKVADAPAAPAEAAASAE